MANRFIAGGPVGISIMANRNIGSSLKTVVFVARSQMKAILMTGQSINLTNKINNVAPTGTCPKCSPRFNFRIEEDSVTPTTTTYRDAKSSPMLDSEVVSHASNRPTSSCLLKKTRCNGGTSPMKAPIRAPISGALKKSARKPSPRCAVGCSPS
jgi:hypothetical protein